MLPHSQANKLLEELGINTLPINPFSICEQMKVSVIEEDFGNSFEGMLLVNSKITVVGLNKNITSKERKIYTCSHEIGHLCMDVTATTKEFKCNSKTINDTSNVAVDIEQRANSFASELLMPKSLVKDIILDSELSWQEIKKFSQLTQVSLMAATKKFLEHTEEPAALIVSHNKKISWFHASNNFNLNIDMTSRLVSEATQAGRIFNGQTGINNFSETHALNWLSSSSAKRDDLLQEWSLPIDSYGNVLTLIWDDQGIAETNDSLSSNDENEDKFDPRYGWETPSFHKKKR